MTAILLATGMRIPFGGGDGRSSNKPGGIFQTARALRIFIESEPRYSRHRAPHCYQTVRTDPESDSLRALITGRWP